MIDIRNKKVLLTGASSMIGRGITKELLRRGATVAPVYHDDCDLLDYNQALSIFKKERPDLCIHAAGYNGNINFNKNYPSDIFYNTTIIGLNTLKAASTVGVSKVVSLLASCAYRSTNEELKEVDFFEGMPDQSVEAHGLSKKTIFYYSKQIHKQFGTTAVCTIFNTAYGPYDSYDINKTKVVGALIKKFTDAAKYGHTDVICWGTGKPRRELIYCDDAGTGIVEALQKYNDVNWPINIGFNQDISIKDLANEIAIAANFKGKIIWDTTKIDGQFRKILNADRMKECNIIIENPTSLQEGIKKTINWYKENYIDG